MNYKTHNDGISFQESTFKGYIKSSFHELKTHFGEPTKGDGWKTDALWEIKFENSVYVEIYNFKNGKNYLKENGKDLNDINVWDVASLSNEAINLINNVLK